MQSDNGIKNADGVSSGDFPEFFEFAIMGMINRGALHFAHAVDDHNQAVVPPGAKIGACCVSQMVVNIANTVSRVAVQIASDLGENSFT